MTQKCLKILGLGLICLVSIGCAKKEDVCDKAIKIVCKEGSSSFDQTMCNEARKYAEAARQNDSAYAKDVGLKFCNDLVAMHEAMIELGKAEKILNK